MNPMSGDRKLSIHDNRLVSYQVHCERREITLHTVYSDGGDREEKTDVTFAGVVAYHFEHDSVMGTIIFEIEEVPAMELLRGNADRIREGIRFGWPGEWAGSDESAEKFCTEEGVRGYQLSSSCGMSGWVLARSMQMAPRDA